MLNAGGLFSSVLCGTFCGADVLPRGMDYPTLAHLCDYPHHFLLLPLSLYVPFPVLRVERHGVVEVGMQTEMSTAFQFSFCNSLTDKTSPIGSIQWRNAGDALPSNSLLCCTCKLQQFGKHLKFALSCQACAVYHSSVLWRSRRLVQLSSLLD